MIFSASPHLAPREHCTGCGACASGCPRGAIKMVSDKEGFLYPDVTEACVHCGHCTHICPMLKHREQRPDPTVFAVWNENDEMRGHSTSGGAFAAIASFVLESGGVVFGAAMDSDMRVVHTAIQAKEDLPRLMGAKLVQSDMGECFQQVRYYLDRGMDVFFTGTPCQVDGLYRFLGESPERLLTADVLCSGVPSPGVWSKTVEAMHYIKQRRDRGETREEAILHACPLRIRPVLMTTLTTILALVPTALGMTGKMNEMMSDMGTTMIAGMLVSTVITLLFTPVYYCVIDDLTHRRERRKAKKLAAAQSEP